MSHTPTPWKVTATAGITNLDETILIACCGDDIEEEEEAYIQQANAAFIVRAVNSFEAMREALEGLIELYEKPYTWKTNNQSAYKKAKEALALDERKDPNP